MEEVVDTALNVKRLINQKATEKNSWLLSVTIKCNEKSIDLLKHLQSEFGKSVNDSELCEILQVGSVTLEKSSDISMDYDVEIQTIDSPLCPRCRRYAVADENDTCQRCNIVLSLQK